MNVDISKAAGTWQRMQQNSYICPCEKSECNATDALSTHYYFLGALVSIWRLDAACDLKNGKNLF